MNIPDLHVCDTKKVVFKDDRYWCLVEKPEDCPFAVHVRGRVECIHPDHMNFFRNKPASAL